jgi:hypothetical protein
MRELTAKQVRLLFDYDELTGLLYWKVQFGIKNIKNYANGVYE